jgi:microcystin-dependent protein
MSNQYIAEIRIFGFNFAPLDWAQCNGQTVAIDQNSTLFQIIGSTFGGNGTTTFNLPNLQDLTAAGIGTGLGLRNWPLGATFGEANHTLLISEVPLHAHSATFGGGVVFGNQKTTPSPTSYPARAQANRAYNTSATTTLAPATLPPVGGSLPHNNIQPVLVMNYCIALFGIFPSQSS